MRIKVAVIIWFCLSVTKLFGQISVGNSDMPASGDTLRYSQATIDQDVLSEYVKSGANQTWDFGFLEAVSQSISDYKAASKTPYGILFYGSFGLLMADTVSFSTYTITNIYNFFKNSTTKFEANGIGLTFNGIPIPAWYTDNDEIYQFPLEYGDRDSSTFYYKVGLGGMLEYSTAGYRINEVDGWGSITTPFGTFNCIRVKTTLISADSVGIQSFKFGFPNQRMEYKWMTNGIEIPVLQIDGNITMGNFTPSDLKYRDFYRNIIDPRTPVPDFAADNTAPSTIDTVTFFNLTAGIGSNYQWNIQPYHYNYVNGTDSLSESPQVLFRKEGNYSVNLYASNMFGSANHSKSNYITVSKNTQNLPTADFTFDIPVPNTTSQVHLTDQSTVFAPSTYKWSFNPTSISFLSGTNASSKNPVVQFNTETTYTITLQVDNFYGSDDVSKTIKIVSAGCEENKTPEFMIYPNPVKDGSFTLIPGGNYPEKLTLSIRDVTGRLILSRDIDALSIMPQQIDADYPEPGLYFVEITGEKTHFVSTLMFK